MAMRPRLLLVPLLLSAACYGAPSNDGSFTHPSGGTTGSSTTPAPISTPAGTTPPAGFTISWQINPNQCLQPASTSAATSEVITAECNGATAQRWQWNNGTYINVATGGCLGIASAAANAAVEVSTCSGSNQAWFNNFGGQLFQVIDGNYLMIAPTSSITGAGVSFQVMAQVAPEASREWIFSINAPDAMLPGFAVTPSNNPKMCLTTTATGPRVMTCGQEAAAQMWNFSASTFSQGNSCLAADQNDIVSLVNCDSTQTVQQFWLGGGGDIVSGGASNGTPQCLFADSNGTLSIVPNSTANRAWDFGAVILP